MNGTKRLTIQYFFRHMLVYAGFPLVAVAITGMLCFAAFSFLTPTLLGYSTNVMINVATVLCFLPLVAGYVGFHIGLRIASRIFQREQMYELLVGLKPSPRSIKSANQLLDRLYTATP